MPENNVDSSTRAIIEGEWSGSVIPSDVSQLAREVRVKPGSVVEGGIFGRSIEIVGPARIDRAVYATSEVKVFPRGRIRIGSSLGARSAVLVEGGADDDRLDVLGDVTARQVTLSNCVVLGSITGREVRLAGGVICLGAVRGLETLQLQGSVVLLAEGREVVFGEGCGLLLPYARAGRGLRLEAPVRFESVDAAHSLLTEADVVRQPDGTRLLTAGARMTALGKVRGQLANYSNFALRLNTRGRSGRSLEEYGFDREALPQRLLPVLDLA